MAKKPITFRRVVTGLLLLASSVVVAAGVAEITDLGSPTITVLPSGGAYPYPAVTDGMTITDGMLRFSAEVSDVSGIVTPPVLTLDGNVLAAEVGHPTPDDSGDGEWDWSRWWVSYSGIVADGPHLLALGATDRLGNAVTATFRLNVVTRPVVTEFQPVSYDRMPRPVISARVSDANTAVDPGSITLTLDGALVPHSYDPIAGRVTYVPPQDLADESYHTAILDVADAGGLSASQAWMFHVTTYPDMADSGIDSCTACHPPAAVPPPAWNPSIPMLPWEGMHVATVRFDGELHSPGQSDCWVCHGGSSGAQITTKGYAICGQCHGRPGDALGYGAGWYHGQHADIEYTPAARNPAFPVRVGRNREMVDCIVCHQPGVTTQRTTGVATGSHDIPEIHKASVSARSVPGCEACHALSLTREHARDGRRDGNGQPITCNTCHRSLDGNVLGAIAGGKTDCLACHARPAYVAAHHTSDSTDESSCRVCHPCYVAQPSQP